ncbi:hypothetical protein CONPUDRAFT_85051 [Coniophora puteana RWD-64-598 SS2]|uniref:Uncharacterized protein n=1 Tax=Coniophora puteana (strain RWD-64-598) TaxID=741705 RepID=A0A5M3MAZ7_CONPW|nr:uncharacterized protein CONPUDRAFT_85051 [Coniophora puteana RWD-64-598 SS2]EIW75785.1 hypothetical protein CONPUDRAFT_85051 [Coniophora puteana RWD-64-598 SS2]
MVRKTHDDRSVRAAYALDRSGILHRSRHFTRLCPERFEGQVGGLCPAPGRSEQVHSSTAFSWIRGGHRRQR